MIQALKSAAILLLLPIVFLSSEGALGQTRDERDALRSQAEQLFSERKYPEALVVERKLAANLSDTGAPANEMAEAYGHLAWYALFAREYGEVLAASERGLALAPDLLWLETNRAHALLLGEREAEARALYLAHKGKRINSDSDKLGKR